MKDDRCERFDGSLDRVSLRLTFSPTEAHEWCDAWAKYPDYEVLQDVMHGCLEMGWPVHVLA